MNAITGSSIFVGISKLISDLGVAAMIIVPTICGLLIVGFSIAQAMASEQHDKEKYGKNRKNVLTVLIWVFSASAIVTLIASYFK